MGKERFLLVLKGSEIIIFVFISNNIILVEFRQCYNEPSSVNQQCNYVSQRLVAMTDS